VDTAYHPVEEIGDKLKIVFNPYFFTEQKYALTHVSSKMKDHKNMNSAVSRDKDLSPSTTSTMK